ncbi:A24 family peptidase [Treponema sp. OttesenSCG-928-L16]|nr:A24 family peptidase [Treponema sp. OttesenSCG-928-L16]
MRQLFLILFLLLISLIDGRTCRIPDILLVSLLGVLLFFDRSEGNSFFIDRGMAALVNFCLFLFIFYRTGGLGFGDVKYAAVLGYALGFEKSLGALMCAASAGLLIYVMGMGFFRWEHGTRIPFAPFLSFGAICSVHGFLRG